MDTLNKTPTQSKRNDMVRILQAVSPETDFSDEETLFGRIIDDYADYAELLENREAEIAAAELRGRNARIEELMAGRQPASDGAPHFGSRMAGQGRLSIFDLASEIQ